MENPQNEVPATEADVRMFTGDQRAGKSTTAVAFAVGDYYTKLTGIVSPNGEEMLKAKSVAKVVNPEDYLALRKMGRHPDKFRYVRIFSESGRQSRLIEIPRGWLVVSPVKIFANFNLYGIRFWLISLVELIQYINTDLFHDAWILSDESGMTDARYSMEVEGKSGAQFYATIGKRNAHFCAIAQYNEMIERRIRLFTTMRVLCSYDKETRYIDLDVKKSGEPSFSTDLYAPPYWRFFNTREIIKVPQYRIDRAVAKMLGVPMEMTPKLGVPPQ